MPPTPDKPNKSYQLPRLPDTPAERDKHLKQLIELRDEHVKVHDLYVTAQGVLDEAREAHRKLRVRMQEFYGVREDNDPNQPN